MLFVTRIEDLESIKTTKYVHEKAKGVRYSVTINSDPELCKATILVKDGNTKIYEYTLKWENEMILLEVRIYTKKGSYMYDELIERWGWIPVSKQKKICRTYARAVFSPINTLQFTLNNILTCTEDL